MDSRRFPFVDSAAGALLDADGRIIRWTPEAEQLLSLRADQACGRRVRELLADPATWPALLAERAPDAWSGRAVVRSGRGEELGIVFQVLPLADGGEGAPAPASRYFVLAAPAGLVAQWRQDQAFTRELFLQDRVGLAVFDERLRLIRTNTHLLPYTGLPPNLNGHRLGDFLQPDDAATVERHLHDVLETGRPLVLTEELVRTIDNPGTGAVMAVSAFRLQAPDGHAIGVTALFTDVTELHRSGERLAVLHRATAAVGGSLSVTGTAEELAAVLAPGLADLAVVEVAEAVFTGEEPTPDRDGRLWLRRTAVAAGPGTGPPAAGPAADAADAVGESVTVPTTEAATASPAALSPTAMTAPLRARGALLGRVTVRRAPGRPPYEPADLDLLREIAARAALALDNARRYTRERRAAVGLQRSLLPPSQAETAAVSASSVYLPTDTATGVGGDWFDVIPLSSARVALVTGDVVGHGLEASATMGRLRTAVRTLADLDLEPDELLVHLDDLVSRLLVEADEPGGQPGDRADGRTDGRPEDEGWPAPRRAVASGATCVYAVYDPVSRRCAIASAGHPPPAVAAPDGTVEYVPVQPGPPLGVGGLPFEVTEVELAPGSILALYTDGLIHGRGGDLDDGMAELRRRLALPGVTTTPLPELGRTLVAGRPADLRGDDVTLLLARTRAVPPGATAVWPVDPDPAAVALVRERTAEQLRAWGLEDLVFTTELVLSELVTNAIRYAGGPVEVRLILAERLTCEVSDPSATQPRMRRARLTDEGGRGLYLVAQLTDRWGSRYTRHGKTIWAEQELPQSQPQSKEPQSKEPQSREAQP
ncbi:SpoIIE family protein phosphatase [Streptomyces sp. CB01881]|uniref:ATP-binding SpoIIE family protein phosphatase n=1 Tax=Streptomyces sp. CB01881 TaxID=2078691 RepID=UPI000CDC28B9|nr:SpoIIE family protein phosphatase [Streptomyces sp. CB01881]AUY49502.1 protein kinase [Streptomyces sp. CB01881]TYC72888.1 GAF domain-containing protein [Streptomyces sp. CB01881]